LTKVESKRKTLGESPAGTLSSRWFDPFKLVGEVERGERNVAGVNARSLVAHCDTSSLLRAEGSGDYSAMRRSSFYLAVVALLGLCLWSALVGLSNRKRANSKNMKTNQNKIRATCTFCLIGPQNSFPEG